MGIEGLNEIVTVLSGAGIRAGEAFPSGERVRLTTPVAAVGLHRLDQGTGVLEAEVQILSPRVLGCQSCQETAVAAMEVLREAGWRCRGEKPEYESGCDCFSMTVIAWKQGQLEELKYKTFTWPENPETFLIRAVREPEYSKADDGTVTYEGLGPLCRTITGKGVFQGASAAASYKALAAFLESDAAGDLIHPVWGTISACLIELKMEEESRENYIVYSFTFREADTEGAIPPLSSITNWPIYTV